jgi:hypothetical protein
MNKKIYLYFVFFLSTTIAFAQNKVGIGTTSPDYSVHVLNNTGEASIGINAASTTAQALLNLSIDSRAGGNALALIKYRLGVAGTIAGIPKSNLSAILADAGAGELLIGTNQNSPIHFSTNLIERVRINGDGKLVTMGGLQFTNIGEAAGKVLTSDASGNATWASLSGTHNHFGETWSGNAISGLWINNTSTDPSAAAVRGYANSGGTTTTTGVVGISNSTNGIGILGNNVSGSSYAPGIGNSGVSGTAGTGTGVYAASITGLSIWGYKSGFGPVARFENAGLTNTDPVVQVIGAGSQPVLELNNGFIKVSGTNKTAFKHTSTAGNTVGDQTNLSYNSPTDTDILIVTHNFSPTGTYLNKSFGVYWTGSTWAIYLEDTSAMLLGQSFNVLVIRQ